MRNHQHLTIIGNRRRAHMLMAFRNSVVEYFNSLSEQQVGLTSTTVVETDKSHGPRQRINAKMHEAAEAMHLAGVNPQVRVPIGPLRAQRPTTIDLIDNVFLVLDLHLEPQMVTDAIERAVGVYESDRLRSIARTINPLFWVGRLFAWIARVPFMALSAVGFDGKSAEQSTIGRIIKGAILLVGGIASVVAIVQGWDEVMALIDRLF